MAPGVEAPDADVRIARPTPSERIERSIARIAKTGFLMAKRSVLPLRTHVAGRKRGRPPTISRESILACASAIAPHELTMVRVAEDLGVHSSSLYRHFESRDELLMELAKQHVKRLQFEPFDRSRWQEWLLGSGMQLYDVLVEFPFLIHADAFEVSRSAMEAFTEPALEHLQSIGASTGGARSLWLGIVMLCGGAALAHVRQVRNPERLETAHRSLVSDRQVHERLPHVARWFSTTDPSWIDVRQELRRSLRWCIAGFDASRLR